MFKNLVYSISAVFQVVEFSWTVIQLKGTVEKLAGHVFLAMNETQKNEIK